MNNAKLKTRPRSEATAKDVGKRRAPVKKAATQRDLYAGHRLCTLRTLPGPLYREVVRRFAYGETAKEVAEFILAEKDRGGCQTFTFHTLRQYLQVLRKKVRAARGTGPSGAESRGNREGTDTNHCLAVNATSCRL